MNENLKKILRDVFSVDTKAGHRIRYHITRALARKDYAETIRFNPGANGLVSIFEWAFTSESYKYWSDVRGLSVLRPDYI